MHGACSKCAGMCGWMFLIVGVLFLLGDLGIWHFWGISWWTVLFVFWGLSGLGMKNCKDCQKKR